MNLSMLRNLLPKAINGSLRDLGLMVSAMFERQYALSTAPASDATAGALTYTAAQCLAGIIVRDPNGAGRSDVLPTAALLVAAINTNAIGPAEIGMLVTFRVINGADAAETITITAGTGGTWDTLQVAGTRIIPQNTSREITLRITAIAPGSEAYVIYM